jgi:hypothetical protein
MTRQPEARNPRVGCRTRPEVSSQPHGTSIDRRGQAVNFWVLRVAVSRARRARTKAGAPNLAIFSRRSTAGSPKASIHPI